MRLSVEGAGPNAVIVISLLHIVTYMSGFLAAANARTNDSPCIYAPSGPNDIFGVNANMTTTPGNDGVSLFSTNVPRVRRAPSRCNAHPKPIMMTKASRIVLVAALAVLSGCVAVPAAPGYYPPPGYAPPAGYAPPPAYYAPPAVYLAPPPVYFGPTFGFGFYGGHRRGGFGHHHRRR